MAIKGSLQLFGVTFPNAYLRLGGVSGGKQSGIWQADVQVFSDGGAAALAYEQVRVTNPEADSSAMDAARVPANLPMISGPFSGSDTPYAVLYPLLKQQYPSFTDA